MLRYNNGIAPVAGAEGQVERTLGHLPWRNIKPSIQGGSSPAECFDAWLAAFEWGRGPVKTRANEAYSASMASTKSTRASMCGLCPELAMTVVRAAGKCRMITGRSASPT